MEAKSYRVVWFSKHMILRQLFGVLSHRCNVLALNTLILFLSTFVFSENKGKSVYKKSLKRD